VAGAFKPTAGGGGATAFQGIIGGGVGAGTLIS
jgi:hypothetical protein